MSRPIVAVIAEDEPLARESLREMLDEIEGVTCAGAAADGRAAVSLVDRVQPDVLLLDVEMPGMDGLQVLEALDHAPLVVFTTAYDRYAVAAFDLHAVDYLRKPFGRRRLERAIERVREARSRNEESDPERARAATSTSAGAPNRLYARLGDRILPIVVDDIVCFDAESGYARAWTRDRSYLLNATLTELDRRLPADRFVRVHRAHLVNIERIREMRQLDDRRLLLIMENGTEIVASRTGTRRLREMIDL